MNASKRVVGIVGWSGSGKTTVLTRVIPILVDRGIRVSTVKRADNGFDVDVPGKDSHSHRLAGATEVLVTSGRRWAHIHELREEDEPSFYEMLLRMSPVDLIIVEGYTSHEYPKVEIYRAELGKPLLQAQDYWVAAVASDTPLPEASVPVIDLVDLETIADVILDTAWPIDELQAEAEKA